MGQYTFFPVRGLSRVPAAHNMPLFLFSPRPAEVCGGSQFFRRNGYVRRPCPNSGFGRSMQGLTGRPGFRALGAYISGSYLGEGGPFDRPANFCRRRAGVVPPTRLYKPSNPVPI